MLRKLLPWLLAAFVLWWVVTDPHGAAAFARHAGAFIQQAGRSLTAFASSL